MVAGPTAGVAPPFVFSQARTARATSRGGATVAGRGPTAVVPSRWIGRVLADGRAGTACSLCRDGLVGPPPVPTGDLAAPGARPTSGTVSLDAAASLRRRV